MTKSLHVCAHGFGGSRHRRALDAVFGPDVWQEGHLRVKQWAKKMGQT